MIPMVDLLNHRTGSGNSYSMDNTVFQLKASENAFALLPLGLGWVCDSGSPISCTRWAGSRGVRQWLSHLLHALGWF
jgi:hypothetical protein